MPERETVLITHANPQNNDVARWFATRLISAGYKVWLDLRSLRGGDDFWIEIERQLKNHAIKQIVLVSEYIRKPGVLKELAIGDAVGRQLNDANFMIPIRIADVPHQDFPSEIFRRNAIDGHPSWASALQPLLETLDDAKIPRTETVDTSLLHQIVQAQEHGRNVLKRVPERLYTNWFTLTGSLTDVWIYESMATVAQTEAWGRNVGIPHVREGRIVYSFLPPESLKAQSQIQLDLRTRGSLKDSELLGPPTAFRSSYISQGDARRHVVNLLRQHWDECMGRRGLQRFEFASHEIGWFFPDGLIEGPIKLTLPDGHRVSRLVSGKFKERRWHLCLIARAKRWPNPLFRVHANLVLSNDGQNPLSGAQTQRLRMRLTKTWWNDKWRDLLLSSMGWLAQGDSSIDLSIGTESLAVDVLPTTIEHPMSYDAIEERVEEENAAGEISLSADYDTDEPDDVELEPEGTTPGEVSE